MIEPIDYITIFSGKNPGVLAQVCYPSLFKTTKLTGVTFHVVNKDCSDEDIGVIKSILSKVDNPCHFYSSPAAVSRRGPGDEQDKSNHDNVALNSDFAISNCGSNQWCVLAHFDIEYKKDFISFCRKLMKPDVALLGQHERFLAVNRRAYKQSSVKFITIAPFLAVPADTISGPSNGEYQLRYANDHRIGPGSLPIRGFDNGELLELEMMSYGWAVYPLIHELRDHITHFGGGGGGTKQEVERMRERARSRIQELEKDAKVSGTLVEPTTLKDGSGLWIVHIDKDGAALCGSTATMKTTKSQKANCQECIRRLQVDQILPTGQAITLVHFAYQVNNEWRLACMPNMKELHQTPYHPNYQRSNETRVVSCPACKMSEVFKSNHQALGMGLDAGLGKPANAK